MQHVNNHVQDSWQGWAEAGRKFGLEMQCPYAEHLISGRKTIETRGYALPTHLLTRSSDDSEQVRIEILESEAGKDGVSSIPDHVVVLTGNESIDDQSSGPFLLRKGWCTFIGSFKYTSREQFEADECKHLVQPTSGYGWDDKRPIYGWVVGTCKQYIDSESSGDEKYLAQRRMRSLFEIQNK
ncbi:hypothetical protein ACHAWO_005967 [Cyclotella atomus]|uniref:Uncharacterized protein n=1 Tax=Cyclotella atomus TaxID=382360 RepID=A0ABD3PJR7_9STRA